MTNADPRIDALAAAVRRTRRGAGRLDMNLTASGLGIRIRTANLGGYLLAATYGDDVVLNMDDRLTAGRIRFAFAHEVAHVLIRRKRMPWVDAKQEEWWADRFAHELVLPRSWVAGASSNQLRQFSDPAEQITLAVQLAGLRRTPPLTRVGDAVACATCGDISFLAVCECARYREDSVLRQTLPEFRLPHVQSPNQLRLFDAEAPRLGNTLPLSGVSRVAA